MKLSMKDVIRIALAELIGTGILMFLGCMGCIKGLVPGVITFEVSCLVFGFAVMIDIQVKQGRYKEFFIIN